MVGVALARVGGVPGVVEGNEGADELYCAFVLRAEGGFKNLVRFQERRLGVCVTFKLRQRLSVGTQKHARVPVPFRQRLPGALTGRGEQRLDFTVLALPSTRCYDAGMNYGNIITIEPGKRGGKPCIRGLRITVYDVLEYLASGMTEAQILSDFPDLTAEDIRACLAFAADRERRLMSIPA